MGKNWNAPASGQAGTGRGMSFDGSSDAPKLAHLKGKIHTTGTAYRITPCGGDAFRIVVSGRVQWALDRLCKAGAAGCTPIKEPAPRWAAYIHRLRELGVEVETITEPHDGDFPGHHARYVLRCGAVRWTEGGAA